MDRPCTRSLADQIERRITERLYPVGSQLPPETLLEREFEVSRTTVRQALALLKSRGILVSRSGLGTVVKSDAADPTAFSFTGSVKDLIYYAARTRYRAVSRTPMTPPPDIAAVLGLARGERVVRFRGLRASRDVREDFALEDVFIPDAICGALTNRDLGTDTLFRRLENAHGFRIVEVQQTIGAVAAPAAVAACLGLRRGVPMLRMTRIYRLKDGAAIECAVVHYDPAKFEYAMKLLPE